MLHNTCTHHIEVNVYEAPQKMFTFVDSRGMIAILPECIHSFFPNVELLSGSSGYELDGFWYNISILAIDYQQMNVVCEVPV